MAKHARSTLSRRGHRKAMHGLRMLVAGAVVATFIVPFTSSTNAGSVTPAPPGQAASLNDALHNSTASFAQALLCPVGKKVKTVTSTIPGVNVLTDQLSNILCALGILGYAYRTTYYPPSGPPLVRYYRALIGLPQAMDVNADGLPDFVGLVNPTVTIPGLQLGITRSGIYPQMKVKVEAFFLDPVDANTYVTLGEDGSLAGAAKYWRASVGAFLTSGLNVDLKASIYTQAPPATLTTTGGVLFGANPDAPDTSYLGSANFTPVPANFSAEIKIGSSSQEAIITSTIRSVLAVNVHIASPGNNTKDIDAIINKIPTKIDIFHQSTGGHEVVKYTANATIDHVLGAYHDRTGNSINTAAQLDITDMPTQLTFDQIDAKTSLTINSGVIGAVEARFALGQDVPASPPGTSPYVAFHRYTASRLTAGLRFEHLKSLSFDSAGPYIGDVVFQPAPGLIPLSFQDDVSGITATGHLSNLPAHITVTIDLTGGHIVFDGHGTGIQEIQVNATRTGGVFFTRANRIDLKINDMPALNTVDFAPNGQSVTFTPSAPIGQVSLLASDGTAAPAVSGDYASYEDTPSLYRIFLQMQSIAGVQFQAAPVTQATLKTGVRQVMTLFAHVDNGTTHNLTLNGTIDKLPTSITVTADVANGHFVYSAAQTIDEIHVTATDSRSNFFARANRLDLDLKGLPMVNTIDFLPSGVGAQFVPSAPITEISLLASDGTGAPAVSGDYASYEDTPSLYRIYLKVLGIVGLSFNAPSNGAVNGTFKTNNAQLMNLKAHVAGVGYDITATGSIDKLPSWIDFSLTPQLGGGETVDYNTHGQVIDHITLDGSGLPLPFNADTAHVVIDHIPSHLTVTIPNGDGTATFDPHGDHIDRVLVQVYPGATGPHNSVAGHQTAYANLNTGQFTADIKNIGLTQFTTSTDNINIQYDISSAPLDFAFNTEDGTQYFNGQISNPEPASITVIQGNRTQINYQVNPNSPNFSGNGEINEIDVQTNLAGYLDVSLKHIAPKLLICFDSGGSKPCKEPFVPQSSFDDADNVHHNMPQALFDFKLVPTDLQGNQWPTRFQLDGTYCFSESDAATCLDSGQEKERIEITDLEFGKVAVGAGYTEDGCTACTAGRVYAYFDTNNTNISGNVKYFEDGDSGPFVEYHTDSSSDGIAAQDLFEFVDFCIICIDETNVYLVHGGSFTCNGDPHLDIDIPVFDDIDVLSGSFISIC